jgi:hypothetical protein
MGVPWNARGVGACRAVSHTLIHVDRIAGGISRAGFAILSNLLSHAREILQGFDPHDEDNAECFDGDSDMPDWIERKDEALRAQASVFSAGISADPEAFGATPLQAAELAEKFAAFDAALRQTRQSFTDCTTATLEKTQARAALVECMRARARTIRAMPSVTQGQMAKLQMPVPEPRRKRVPRPADTPDIRLGRPDGRSIPLHANSTLTPTRRGLPRDVAGIQVFCIASATLPPISETAWRSLGTFSRATFTLNLNLADINSGDAVWIIARYVNAKAQPGNWARAVCTYALGPAMLFKNADPMQTRAA